MPFIIIYILEKRQKSVKTDFSMKFFQIKLLLNSEKVLEKFSVEN